MISIVDYGLGNLFSLKSSLSFIGAEAVVSSDHNEILSSDKIILPGVGAFEDAAAKLKSEGLDDVLRTAVKKDIPLLGICLGMQLLFDLSLEFGTHEGLGFIPGEVRPIKAVIPPGMKIPHIGWNSLNFTEAGRACPIFKYINEGDYVYFVHSYYGALCDESITAEVDYGVPLTAAVMRGNVFGTQFHPEKSGEAGLNILRAFAEI